MTDLPGQAIFDYHFLKEKTKLFVHDEFGPKVEMPVKLYFRPIKEMPILEQKALDICKGKIIDIGAGAGSHALELQSRGLDVTALEISPKACEVMRARGVESTVNADIFEYSAEKFDTLLLLMNGIGLCGDLKGFEKFLKQAESLLNPGGSLIFDSCDIAYMFENNAFPNHYYGEVKCRYEYKKELTNWFSWLYLDPKMMIHICKKWNWDAEIIFEDKHQQYLTSIKKQ